MSEPTAAGPNRDVIAMTFARRVGIAAAVLIAARMVSLMLVSVNVAIVAYRVAPSLASTIPLALHFAFACAVVTGMLLILLHAQRSVIAGRRQWLASIPESRLIISLAALLLLSRIAPRFAFDSSLYDGGNSELGSMYHLAMRGLSTALAVAACYIWIWWCNCPPRAERLVIVSALAWVGFEFLLDAVDMAVPTLNVLVSRTTGEGWTLQLPGSDAFVTISGRSWIWRVGAENLLPSLGPWLMNVVATTAIASAAAVVLYWFLNRDASPTTTR